MTKIREIFLILRSSDANFTLKCFFFKYSNSKFTAFFLQKIQKIKILIFYLIADNQLKRGTIYKKKIAKWAGADEWKINYELPNQTRLILFRITA